MVIYGPCSAVLVWDSLHHLFLEKQYRVSAVQLILPLCLFRINGKSIHSIYNKQFYNLLETGKDYYYRILNRSTMDWRKLHLGRVSRFFTILRKELVEESNQPRCYMFDDTTLNKSWIKIERINHVFDHVKGNCILGYKLLLMCFFDGLSKKQLKAQYTKKREKENPDYTLTDSRFACKRLIAAVRELGKGCLSV